MQRDEAKIAAEHAQVEAFLRKNARRMIRCPLGPLISRKVCLQRQCGNEPVAKDAADYARHKQKPGCWLEFCQKGVCPVGNKMKKKGR